MGSTLDMSKVESISQGQPPSRMLGTSWQESSYEIGHDSVGISTEIIPTISDTDSLESPQISHSIRPRDQPMRVMAMIEQSTVGSRDLLDFSSPLETIM